MITYRFNRKWVRDFATEAEAFEHSLSYDDNVQAVVERDLGRGWELFVETYDGNGRWVPDPRDVQFRAELQRQAENNLGGINYQPSGLEGRLLRKLQNKNGCYRGWNVYPMASGYGIRRQGWQGYANFKTIEAAMAKVDAIVG
jgi:hypothetical protein